MGTLDSVIILLICLTLILNEWPYLLLLVQVMMRSWDALRVRIKRLAAPKLGSRRLWPQDPSADGMRRWHVFVVLS